MGDGNKKGQHPVPANSPQVDAGADAGADARARSGVGSPEERGQVNGRPNTSEQVKTEVDADDRPDEKTPMYRRKRVLIPLFLFIIASVVTWWYWNHYVRGFNSTDDAFIDGDRVGISSKILGRVAALAAAEGDTVRQGEVIVRLDSSDLKAQLAQGSAAVNSAQQNLALARVNFDRATDDFHRAQEQFRQNVIPKEQFDHAQSAVEVARAQYAIAAAQIDNTKAQLAVTQTQLQNTSIASPINGVVSKRWVLAGDIVQPGQPIYTVYDIHHVWVTANFEETKLGSIHTGDSVEVSVDAYPDVQFYGTVIQIGSNTASQFSLIPPSNASGNFTKVTQRVPIKISVAPEHPEEAKHPLLPGMSVEVKIKVNE